MCSIVYISGPITNCPNWRKNFSVAHQTLMGQKKYDMIINPLLLSQSLEKQIRSLYKREPTYEEYLVYDLQMLSKATHIYMLKGWEKSKGALIEKKYAEENGMEVMYEDEKR